ncbi:MAG TPA: hypothetical protein VD886_21360 [Herpetosiphonaceae bacterium]|nr:hypothetical protein [Herpetosiphonaceae bacterium]
MYRVPPSHSLDPRLRRAIALAVALCSLGAGFLAMLLNERPSDTAPLIGLVLYFGLLAACWFSGTKGWTKRLYALAAFGLALGLACVAVRLGLLFHIAPRSPWHWDRLAVPVVSLAVAPFYIRRFWRSAGTRAGQD